MTIEIKSSLSVQGEERLALNFILNFQCDRWLKLIISYFEVKFERLLAFKIDFSTEASNWFLTCSEIKDDNKEPGKKTSLVRNSFSLLYCLYRIWLPSSYSVSDIESKGEFSNLHEIVFRRILVKMCLHFFVGT